MKRLSKDQRASILLALRDAVFQQIADAEESMTDDAEEEAKQHLERHFEEVNDDAVQKTINKELRAIFNRIYEAIKKGDDR